MVAICLTTNRYIPFSRLHLSTCPICGGILSEGSLEKLGLDYTHLEKIRETIRSNKLAMVMDLGDIALKYLHPEHLGTEFQVHDALEILSNKSLEIAEKQRDFLTKMREDQREDRKSILEEHQQELLKLNVEAKDAQKKLLENLSQINSGLSQIRERIVGPGIGGPGEIISIKELKSAFPADSFTNAKAAAGGPDIVAKVNDGTMEAGRIVVSVKYQDKWKDDFLDQLKRNLSEVNTEFGVLVSRVFPSDALNDRVYLTDDGYAVVKPEYATIAYMGMREAAIHLHRARAAIRGEMDRIKTREQVTMAIRDWLSGENFSKAVKDLDLAIQASNETVEIVQKWQTYADEKSRKIQSVQQDLRTYILACGGLLGELRERLAKTGPKDIIMGPDLLGRSAGA